MSSLTMHKLFIALLIASALSGCESDEAEAVDAASRDAQVETGPTGTGDTPPPLYLFTNIHTHLNRDHQPYRTPALNSLDENSWTNVRATVERASALYRAYEIPVNWHASYGILKAGCRESSLFNGLRAMGDQVGIHTHRSGDIALADDMARNECGFAPTAASGLNAEIGRLRAPTDAAASWLDQHVARGYRAITIAPIGSSLDRICERYGVGNTMTAETGSPLFPWRPTLSPPELCQGEAGPLWIFAHPTTPNPHGEGAKPDILGADHFAIWIEQMEAALDYLAENRPSQIAVWGTVWALPFAAPGNDGSEAPSDSFYTALETFLQKIASYRDAGLIIPATTQSILEAAEG